MELRVHAETGLHTTRLRPHEREDLRGPWSEVADATGSDLPFVILGMIALAREGGRAKIEIGYGPAGKERGIAEVRLRVDTPPFDPEMRGITEPIVVPSRQRIAARYVRLVE